MALWVRMVENLHWTPKHAEMSAKLALSKAAWLGIDKDRAIQQVFEMALGGFFQANPHIPFQSWQTVSDQIEGRAEYNDLSAVS